MSAVERRNSHFEQFSWDPPPTNVGLPLAETDECRRKSMIAEGTQIIKLDTKQIAAIQSQIQSNENFIERELHVTIVMIIAIATVLIPICLKASAAILFPTIGVAVLFFMFAPVIIRERYDNETAFCRAILETSSREKFDAFLRKSINKLEYDKRLRFQHAFMKDSPNLCLVRKAYELYRVSQVANQDKNFVK